jgi:hypothetical protein
MKVAVAGAAERNFKITGLGANHHTIGTVPWTSDDRGIA